MAYIDEEEARGLDEEAARTELRRRQTALRRKQSSFFRETETRRDGGRGDWGRVWRQFQAQCGEQGRETTFFRNTRLQGAWAAFEYFVDRFETVVRETSQVLVNERHLDNDAKTIKSLDVGGMAGGTKFIHANVFFKLAVSNNGMYGDGGNAAAAKTAGNELTNLGAIAKLVVSQRTVERGKVVILRPKIPHVFIPFAMICDFDGFRIFASTLVPIGDDTIQYGSSDGGRTVYNRDFECEARAKDIAQYFGLKQHQVGRTERLWLAGDVELHRGLDGRIWLLDAARLVPPFPPPKHERYKILNEFFPIEFVRHYCNRFKCAVSADAFSGFNKNSKEKKADNEQVAQMSEFYFDHWIGEEAARLDADPEIELALVRVCKRHFGRLLQRCTSPSVCKNIRDDMVLRAFKQGVRAKRISVQGFFAADDASLMTDLLSEIQAKFGTELGPADVDLTLLRSKLPNIGIDATSLLPVPIVKKIPCLVKLTQDTAPPLLRGETIAKRPKRADASDEKVAFDNGFWNVLRNCNLGDSATAFLESYKRANLLHL